MWNCLEWPDVRFLGMNFLYFVGWLVPVIVWLVCWFAGKKFPCVMWYHSEMTPFLAKGYWFCDFDRNQRFAMRTKQGFYFSFFLEIAGFSNFWLALLFTCKRLVPWILKLNNAFRFEFCDCMFWFWYDYKRKTGRLMYDVSQPDMYRANGVAVPLARDMVTEDRPLIYRVNMGEVGIFVEIELEDEYWEWRRYQLLKVSLTTSNHFQK